MNCKLLQFLILLITLHEMNIIPVGPTLKLFLFPLTRPCFSDMGGSVRKLFFLTPKISSYLLNFIVNSPNIDNKSQYTKNATYKLKISYLKITLFTLNNSLN